MNLPTTVRLTRCETGAEILGTITTLSREDAKNEVDAVWWQELADTLCLCDPTEEPDSHWKWRAIVSVHQNKPRFRAQCIRTDDAQIQAAMLYQVNALSALHPGQRAVFIDRLATAPRNRGTLVKFPVYRGAGTGLLIYAVAVSYSLGLGGRVNLIPVANEGFYSSLGFQPTSTIEESETLFELPADVALDLLASRGLIDDP